MKKSDRFVPLATLDPEAARLLGPGVTMLVSTRTFAEIAEEKRQQRLDRNSQAGVASGLLLDELIF